jgi:hypothetical protein
MSLTVVSPDWGISASGGSMAHTDVSYFMGKAREERELAERSEDRAAAETHLALADQYEQIVAAYQPIIALAIRGFH